MTKSKLELTIVTHCFKRSGKLRCRLAGFLVMAMITTQLAFVPPALGHTVKAKTTGSAPPSTGPQESRTPQLAKQEAQVERDGRVVTLEIKPENPSVMVKEDLMLMAIPFDSKRVPVGGVALAWSVVNLENKADASISEQTIFRASRPGKFEVVVEGGGQKASTTVTVFANRAEKNAAFGNVTSTLDENDHYLWNENNYLSAKRPENERGERPEHPLGINGNFQLDINVLKTMGRGLGLDLNLTYNSRLWNASGNDITYDIDKGWPAPGWSFSFPKIVLMGEKGSMLIEGDGTRHPFTGFSTPAGSGHYTFIGHTTDGTFIQYSTGFNGDRGVAQYPNGMRIEFMGTANATGHGVLEAFIIADVQGNNIAIARDYSPGYDGAIRYIKDTLGRVVFFYYDDRKLLTAITAAGPQDEFGNVEMRTLLRLHYKKLRLSYSFSNLNPLVRIPEPYVIDAVYYPATRVGYWFGDYDSYSFYGMIRKVIHQRNMSFIPATSDPEESLSFEGQILPGQMTSQGDYSYPLTASTSLNEGPTFDEFKLQWEGMEGSPRITRYDVHLEDDPRTTKITQPDNTYTIQFTENKSTLDEEDPNKFRDGLLIKEQSFSAAGVRLSEDRVFGWEQGYLSSPRSTRVERSHYIADNVELKTATEVGFGPKYNEPIEVRHYGFNGELLQRIRTVFRHMDTESGGGYNIKLPLSVEVFADLAGQTRLSYQTFQYDEDANLALTPGVIQHNGYSNGSLRGNVTSTTVYLDPSNPQPTRPVTERTKYDQTGNVISVKHNDQQQSAFVYNVNTQYAYPVGTVRGSTDPASPVKITTSAGYDFNTGLVRSQIDQQGRETKTQYDPATLRASRNTLPTGAVIEYGFDDVALSATRTTYLSLGGTIAGQEVFFLDGLGATNRVETRAENGAWNVVRLRYDNMNRVHQKSLPYFRGGTPHWVTSDYDDLGRVILNTQADGSRMQFFYDEPVANRTLPTGARDQLGHSLRTVDPWGREHWALSDARGQVVQVVEPHPQSNGQVSADGYLTRYQYNSINLLSEVIQGVQHRVFRYDESGRLTHERVPEKDATLNDAGIYVGSGQWSAFFEYDDRSNMIANTDARGVRTFYSYNNDALNRLQFVRYDIPTDPAHRDPSSPIHPAGQVNYSYMPDGDITRIKQVATDAVNSASYQAPGVTETYGFDLEGRPSQKTVTTSNAPGQPMVIKYEYDSFGREKELHYPDQYGTNQTRKKVHSDYGVDGDLKALSVNGISYASSLEYNAMGNVTSVKIGPAGLYQDLETYEYDNDTGLLTNQKVTRGASTLLNLGYEYLRPGTTEGRSRQITRIVNNLDHTRDRAYEYDALGRLRKVTGGFSTTWNQQYDYDRFGNRKTVTVTGSLSRNIPANHNYPVSPQSHLLNELAALTAPPTFELILKSTIDSMLKKREGSTENSNLPFNFTELANPSGTALANSAAPAALPVPLPTYDGIYISNNLPATVVANQSVNFNVVMRNTGERTWITAILNYDGNVEICSYDFPTNLDGWKSSGALLPYPGEYPTGTNVNYLLQPRLPTRAGTYLARYSLCRDPSPHINQYIWFGTPSPVIEFHVLPSLPYDALFVSQSIPAEMNSGQTYTASVTLKNIGVQPWKADSTFALQAVATDFGILVPEGTRVLVPRQVEPDETFTFEFPIHAPFQPGTYKTKWKMYQGNYNPFGDTTPEISVQVLYTPDNTFFTTQNVPTHMIAGQMYPVSVMMKNAGSNTWTTGVYRLGSQDPANNNTWGLNRVDLPLASIAPSLDATFNFSVTAPAQLGHYSFQWGMLREVNGGQFFGESSAKVFVDVVNSLPSPTPTPIPTPTPTPRINVALQFNGGAASASSSHLLFPSYMIDGDRIGYFTTHWWADNTNNQFPDWAQINFAGVKTISEIDVISLQESTQTPYPPSLTTIFTTHGNTIFDVRYWDESVQDWRLVPNGQVTGNNRIWRKFTFSPISTSKIQILITNALNNSNLVELEAYQYLTATPTPTPVPSPTPPGDQLPFFNQPLPVPGTVQAEDFDKGNDGVAYHDVDPSNNGGAYRSTGVDIEATADSGGGFNVGWISTDEWLEYSVKVATTGLYKLEARVASNSTGRKVRFEFDGVDKSGEMLVPNTGSGQVWQTINSYVRLKTGAQVMRAYVSDGGGGFNFNYVQLTAVMAGAAPLNLAAGKSATQSSDFGPDFLAPRAVDSNTEGNSALRSISSTDIGQQSWWQVDLGSVQYIDNIKVWNRTDCCGERLQDFYVFISNEPFASNDVAETMATPGVSYLHIPGQSGNLSTLSVNRSGRYVRVQLNNSNYLSLAEVEVWGAGGLIGPSIFFDDFNDNMRDPSKWIRMLESSTVSVAETNQQLEITSDPMTAIFDGYESVNTVDLTDANAAVEVVQPMFEANQETRFELWGDQNDWASFSVNNDELIMRLYAPPPLGGWFVFCNQCGSELTEVAIHYNRESQRFWRFRHAQPEGEIELRRIGLLPPQGPQDTLEWETSADGVTWVSQLSMVRPFDISTVLVRLSAGTSLEVGGFPFPVTPAIFDNLRVALNHPDNPPTVSITAPAQGSVFTTPANITIAAAADDSDGSVVKVEFFEGPTKLGEDSSAPFSFDWTNVGTGTYSITAVATDSSGQSTTSSPLAISVALPIVNVTASAPRAAEPGTQPSHIGAFTVTRSGSTSQPLAVAISLSGTAQNGVDYVSVSNSVTIPAGQSSQTVNVQPIDDAINEGNETVVLTVSGSQAGYQPGAQSVATVDIADDEVVPPQVSITSPAANASFTPPLAGLDITADASDADGSVTKVEFFSGTTKLGEDTAIPYSYTWTNLFSGTYSLTAKATDNQGGITTSAPVTITVTSTSSLSDDFNDNLMDQAKWTTGGSSVVSVVEQNQTLKITPPASATGYDGYFSRPTLDLTGGRASVEVVQSTPAIYGIETTYSLVDNSTGNYLLFDVSGGGFMLRDCTNGVNAQTLVPFDPAQHRFWRFRHEPTADTINWDTSANGITWTTLRSVARPFTITGLQVQIYAGKYTAGTATSTAIFDNFSATRYYTLVEDFNDNSLDLTVWSFLNTGSATAVREINQQLQITLQPNTADYFGVRSVQTYDLRDRTLQVEIVQPISQAGWAEQYFQAKRDDQNFFHMSAGAGSFVMEKITGGVHDRTVVDFDAVNFRFWRFRHDSAANTMSFETSPNGQNWTARKVVQADFPVDNIYVVLLAGAWGTGNSWPGSAIFDNVVIHQSDPNQPPSVSLLVPADGTVFAEPGSIDLAAGIADSDGVVSKVEFFQGATKIGEDTTEPFAFQWSSVPFGRYTLTAKATDNSGAVTTSAPVHIRVAQPDTIGVYRNSTFYLRNSNTTGPPNITQAYGTAAWKPVVGDWDGNGTTTLGSFVPDAAAYGAPGQSLFFISNSTNSSVADFSVVFGLPGDIPLAGDWDGNGTDTIGVFRPSNQTFYLRNSNSAGAADLTVPFLTYGDTPLAGDWNGDGVDTIGIHNSTSGTFYLRNSNSSGAPDVVSVFGGTGNKPVVGDWNGDGSTTLGVMVPDGTAYGAPGQSVFLLSNGLSGGAADLSVVYGLPGDKPLAGNWNGQLPTLRDAAFVSQSVPSSMTAGRNYDVSVTMRNTGSETWTPETGYQLGTQNPADNITWGNTALGFGRVALAAPVPGNGTTTFTFTVTAPTTPGSYNFQRAMIRQGVWIGDSSANIAVTVDPANSVSVAATDSVAAEPGIDTGTFVVTRTGDTSQALAVNYALTGTATNGTDFVTLPAAVTIPAGAASQTITVTPIDDALVENTETVVLTLSSSPTYGLGTPVSATVSIADKGPGIARPSQYVTWNSIVNGIDAGSGTLRNTAASGVATAAGAQSLARGDGYFEATASGYSQNLGIVGSDGTNRYIVIGTGGWAAIYENGVEVAVTCCSGPTIPVHAPGQRYRLEISGSVLRYVKYTGATRVILYTSTAPIPPAPLTLSASINNQNTEWQRAVIAQHTQNVTWENVVNGIDAGGGTVRKTSADGWNFTAVPQERLVVGDGYFESTSSSANLQQISVVGANGAARTLLFGSGGWAAIYENGAEVAATCCSGPVIPVHVANDRYRIEVVGGVLRYVLYRGGTRTVMFTSANALPTYPIKLQLDSYPLNSEWQNTVVAQTTRVTGWESIVNGIDLGGGSVRKTSADAWNFTAVPQERLLAGDGYFESTSSSANLQQISVVGSDGAVRSLLFGSGGWAAIYENGAEVAATCCSGPVIPVHLANDRYRIEVVGGVLRYVLYRGGTRTIMFTSANALPAYPIRAQLDSNPLNSEWQKTLVRNNAPEYNNASFVSQTATSTMLPGQTYAASLVLKNTGASTWTSDSDFRLSSVNAADNQIWGLNRVNLSAPVAPGETATFNFNVTAPATPGTYNFQWQMIRERVERFGATTTNISIIVNNTAPTVALTAPANNATFSPGTPITVSATASDIDGSVANVKFFQNGNSLGVDTTAPYTIVWNGAAVGNYAITAKATDNHGATSTTAANNISVVLPVVTVTVADANAAEQAANTATFTVNRTGTTGASLAVNFVLSGTAANGVDYSSITSPVTIPAGAGSTSVVVTPIDDALVEGTETVTLTLSANAAYTLGSGTSAGASITDNDTHPPVVSITSPVNGATFTAPATITIDAAASDSDGNVIKVEFFQNGSKIGERTAEPFSLTWTNVAVGTYPLTAKATDNGGGVTISAPVSVSVSLPVVTTAATDSFASEQGPDAGTFTVYRTGATTQPLTVSFTVGGSATSGGDYNAFGTSVVIPAGASSSVVSVIPVDDATVEGSESVSLTVSAGATYSIGSPASANITIADNDANPPTVTLTAPAQGATFTAPATIDLAATANDSDGSVSKVEFFQNGIKIGEDTTAGYAFQWRDVPAGSYSLTAWATDNAGATTISSAVNVSVSLPTITIVASDASASEAGANPGAFTVSRTGNTSSPLLLNLLVAGTAVNGTDYNSVPNSLIIPSGAASANININPIDDTAFEPTETVTFTVINGGGYLIGSPQSATIFIADNDAASGTNVALASNGATATASSTHPDAAFSVLKAINGSRTADGGYWNDGTPDAFPDSLEIAFNGSKTIDEIDVFSLQDNLGSGQPDLALTFTQFGLVDFQLDYLDIATSQWIRVPQGSVLNNNRVWRQFIFAPVTTTRIKLTVQRALATWSRVVEIEAYQATNVALGKSVAQSSTFSGSIAERAVDGNTNGDWNAGSTTHTNVDAQAWWQADLGSIQPLSSIKLWNRTDCCGDRLSNFHIFVSDVPFASTSLTATIGQTGVSDYYVPGAAGSAFVQQIHRTGRYLRVQLVGSNALSLAEVEVWRDSPGVSSGCQSSQDIPVEQFVRNFYQAAFARQPSAGELQAAINSLTQAYAGGSNPMIAAARSLGDTLFLSPEYAARNRSDRDFVWDLYWSYLPYGPDQEGWDFWTHEAGKVNGRANVRFAFDTYPHFYDVIARVCPSTPFTNQLPTANPGGPYTGTLSSPVQFTSTSSDPDGSISVQQWNFGDESTAVGATPAHSFLANAAYPVTLMVRDNQGALRSATTTALVEDAPNSTNSAVFVSQSVPATMNAGQPYTISVTMQNTGTTTWTTESRHLLGAINPDDSPVWRITGSSDGRVAPTLTVAPGETTTFTFEVIAPSIPGQRDFQRRMLQHGVGWFGQPTQNVVVNVVGPVNIPADGVNLTYNEATNRITTSGYEYDREGNLIRAPNAEGVLQRLQYDADGRLVKVTDDSGSVVLAVHTYGESRQRITTTQSSVRTYFCWDGESVITEYAETSDQPNVLNWSKNYIYLGSSVLAVQEVTSNRTESLAFHHPDTLGTRLISDVTNNKVTEQVTLPFGTALDAESTGAFSRRFTSYDRSDLTGLDYAINRFYSARQGRFIQADPIGIRASRLSNPQSFNLYSYAGNDPVNETDPDGLWIFGVSFSWGGSRGGINVSFLINGWLAYTFGLFQRQQAQNQAMAMAPATRAVAGSGSSPQQQNLSGLPIPTDENDRTVLAILLGEASTPGEGSWGPDDFGQNAYRNPTRRVTEGDVLGEMGYMIAVINNRLLDWGKREGYSSWKDVITKSPDFVGASGGMTILKLIESGKAPPHQILRAQLAIEAINSFHAQPFGHDPNRPIYYFWKGIRQSRSTTDKKGHKIKTYFITEKGDAFRIALTDFHHCMNRYKKCD